MGVFASLTRLLSGCERSGPDEARIRDVAVGAPGVQGADLRIEKTGSGGRSLRGTIALPEGREEARRVFDDALKAISDELGGEALGLSIYVYGQSGSTTLTTSDVGAPLNPTSVQLWNHYHG